MYRKTNVNDILNKKVPIQDRLVTFEGAEHFCTSGKHLHFLIPKIFR